ncbi:hypothetical protein ES705_45786 [subsurface metagenome]
MKTFDVVAILTNMAENHQRALDIDQIHALLFATAVIRSLSPSLTDCIDQILDLNNSRHKQ